MSCARRGEGIFVRVSKRRMCASSFLSGVFFGTIQTLEDEQGVCRSCERLRSSSSSAPGHKTKRNWIGRIQKTGFRRMKSRRSKSTFVGQDASPSNKQWRNPGAVSRHGGMRSIRQTGVRFWVKRSIHSPKTQTAAHAVMETKINQARRFNVSNPQVVLLSFLSVLLVRLTMTRPHSIVFTTARHIIETISPPQTFPLPRSHPGPFSGIRSSIHGALFEPTTWS